MYRVRIRNPLGKGVDETQAVLEVLGALQEPAAVVHESVGRRAGRRDLLQGLRLGAARRLRVEAGRGGELGQLALRISLGERRLLGGGVAELGPGDAVVKRLLLHHAACVDGVLDGDDAPRGERLALAEVLELHRVLDALRYLVRSAEHVRDGVPEEVARGVVRVLEASQTPRADADPVVLRRRDGAAREGALAARAGDRLALPGFDALRREVGERLERCVVSVDVLRCIR